MNMHAIAHHFEVGESAVRCVRAGCDLVLTDQWGTSYDALALALQEERVSARRVREAFERVRAVKAEIFGPDLAHPQEIRPEAAQVSVGTPAHAEVAEHIAAASITLVDGNLTPPTPRPLIMATRMARRFGPPVEVQLRAALTALGWRHAEVLMLDPMPDGGQIEQARERAEAAGWAALLHFNRVQSFDPEAVLAGDELVILAEAVAASGTPTTVVSMGSPYTLPMFSAASARLCAYSTCDASLRAVLRVLMGLAPAPGQLPAELEREEIGV
jgi:beta-N-acetylhexosaminidase